MTKRETKKFHKYQPQRFRCRVIHAGWAVRSLTAAVMMLMAVLAPVHLVRSYAAPMPDEMAMAPVLVAADYSERRTLFSGGLSRDRQARILAMQLLMRAGGAEHDVTEDMKALEQGSAHLQGLEYRMKSVDSLTRKILADAEADQVSLPEAAAGIGDALRYTLVAEDAAYSRVVPQSVRQLTNKGYTVEKFRNAWGGEFYQGVNVHLKSPSGMKVELQFHTPQSFAIKQASHEVYEIRRSPDSTPAEIEEATRRSIEYNNRVTAPVGASDLHIPLSA